MAKATQIVDILEDDCEDTPFGCPHNSSDEVEDLPSKTATAAFCVQTCQSPYMDTFHGHTPVRITIDSGATGYMIRPSLVRALHAYIESTSQSAHQADGSSPFKGVGETRLSFTRGRHNFAFHGLVVENLDVDVLAGTSFMEANDAPWYFVPLHALQLCGQKSSLKSVYPLTPYATPYTL